MAGMLIVAIHTLEGEEDAVMRTLTRTVGITSVTTLHTPEPQTTHCDPNPTRCDGLPLARTTCPDRAAHM